MPWYRAGVDLDNVYNPPTGNQSKQVTIQGREFTVTRENERDLYSLRVDEEQKRLGRDLSDSELVSINEALKVASNQPLNGPGIPEINPGDKDYKPISRGPAAQAAVDAAVGIQRAFAATTLGTGDFFQSLSDQSQSLIKGITEIPKSLDKGLVALTVVAVVFLFFVVGKDK